LNSPLTYWLSRLTEGVNSDEIELEPAQLELADLEIGKLDLIRLSLTLVRTREDVLVSGFAVSAVSQSCVRCLKTVTTPINAQIELLVRPFGLRTDPRSGRGRDTDKEVAESEQNTLADGTLYYSGESFSISDEVRQAVAVEIPGEPVCSKACRGLCPSCGIDRNIDSCRCEEQKSGDSRWTKLQQLIEETGDQESD